ncbi:hypothetical protein JM93_03910 [Roseibium hamelinense]|uniref:Uncharacterized protein n=1 Tax=Roseibium hamelinense TaxID=150831 RepID=A0A562SHE2_9HYPH|nr:hypothetical protein [Roseibium hamelinense]MTI42504.1 hypothetical protein [Roseibium hamelinense]TWI80697.1 hypothetical protein JM93_03910 [Roseibium hamelinense]
MLNFLRAAFTFSMLIVAAGSQSGIRPAYGKQFEFGKINSTSAKDIADVWTKAKAGNEREAWATSYWPDDFLLDATIGENKTPAMAQIMLRIENQLHSIYQYEKSSGCKKNAAFAAWQHVKDRNSLLGNRAAIKDGVNFIKDILTLPTSMTKKLGDVGRKAFADKVEDAVSDQAKSAAKQALEIAQKYMKGLPPEVYEDNMASQDTSWIDYLTGLKFKPNLSSSSMAGRCNVSFRIVWNKKESRYYFILIANDCECDCKDDEDHKVINGSTKAMVLSGSGRVDLVRTGKTARISVSRPLVVMDYECCDNKDQGTASWGGSTPKEVENRKKALRIQELAKKKNKELPALTHEERLAADEARKSVSIQAGNSDAEISKKAAKYRQDIKAARTLDDINRIGRQLQRDRSDAQHAQADGTANQKLLNELNSLLDEANQKQDTLKKAEAKRSASKSAADKVSMSALGSDVNAMFASLDKEPTSVCGTVAFSLGTDPLPCPRQTQLRFADPIQVLDGYTIVGTVYAINGKDVDWESCANFNPVTQQCMDGATAFAQTGTDKNEVCLSEEGELLLDVDGKPYDLFHQSFTSPVLTKTECSPTTDADCRTTKSGGEQWLKPFTDHLEGLIEGPGHAPEQPSE